MKIQMIRPIDKSDPPAGRSIQNFKPGADRVIIGFWPRPPGLGPKRMIFGHMFPVNVHGTMKSLTWSIGFSADPDICDRKSFYIKPGSCSDV